MEASEPVVTAQYFSRWGCPAAREVFPNDRYRNLNVQWRFWQP